MRTKYVFASSILCLLATCAQAQLKLRTYVRGLDLPIAMVQDPTRADIQYVVQKEGLIRVIQNGTILSTNFINLTGSLNQNGEKFLFSLAFAPDYATSGKAYVCYVDNNLQERVQQFTRSASNSLQLDPASGRPVIVMPTSHDHWGGTIHFGPDGMLYIGLGDGDLEEDPNNLSQNPNMFHGKMLRIDPSRDDFPFDLNRNYGIPIDNPFVNGSPIQALPEIWDFGFRNPWKWSFDSPALGGNGAMLIGDVGQANWEEIDYEAPGDGGRNYGWKQREGFYDSGFGGASAFGPVTDPIYAYPHVRSAGACITGGYVYRGTALPARYRGRYFYADFITSQLWSLRLTNGVASNVIEHTGEIGYNSAGLVSSFDIDSTGEMYLVGFYGTIKKIVYVPPISAHAGH